ncbi:MAG: hypothetical protein PHV23_04840 [Candidatus Gracilibacteria bacterium]|nr:hypothetical protein [Candidatus Gracilibacteria bacterium]
MYGKILKFVLYIFILIGISYSNLLNVYGLNNPYGDKISINTKVQINNLVISISNRKTQLGNENFNSFKNDILKNLNSIKTKYSSNNEIGNLIDYISYEINDITKAELISEDDLEKIVCSTGKCENISSTKTDNGVISTTINLNQNNSNQNLGNDFGDCEKSGPLYYKSGNICTWANFECKNGKYYWGAQFSPEPPHPEAGVKLYNTYNFCNIDTSVSESIINNTVKSCTFNLTPYYNLGLKTTFYYSDKSYIPDSNGNMTLPGDMVSNFYLFKGDATNPQVYFKCSDGVLSIYNSEYKALNPLNGVINDNNTSFQSSNSSQNNTISNTPNIKNINITCAGNGWPASIEISGSGDFNLYGAKNGATNKYINLTRNSSTNNYLAQLSSDIEKVVITPYNSSEIISSVDVNQCNPNNYAAKPEILSANYNTGTNTIVVKTKNALTNDYIDIFNGQSNGGLFWEKDNYGTYSAKLNDPYYQSLISFIKTGKSYVGIYGSFEPNYWRNSIRNITVPVNVISEPDFSFTRSYDSKGQWLERKTSSNVVNLARKSIGPNGIRSNDKGSLNLEKEFLSFADLKKYEWLSGKYDMTWSITLKNGTIETYKEYFDIPQQ